MHAQLREGISVDVTDNELDNMSLTEDIPAAPVSHTSDDANDCSSLEQELEEDVVVSCESGQDGNTIDGDIFMASFFDENRILLPLEINGITTEALVDTGSSTCLICRSWLDEANISFVPTEREDVFGFGNKNKMAIIGLVQLSLQIHNLIVAPQIFRVVDCGRLRMPIILAIDFLTTNLVTVDVHRCMLSQRCRDGSVREFHLRRGTLSCAVVWREIPCYAAETCILSAGSPTLLPVECDLVGVHGQYCDGCLCKEPDLYFDELDNLKDIQVLPGLIKKENPCVMVVFQGLHGKIKKGQHIGTISSVFDPVSNCLSKEVSVVNVPTIGESDHSNEDRSCDVFPKAEEFADSLSSEQKESIVTMLTRQAEVFSAGDDDIGKLGATEHRIDLWDNTPIYQKPRRFPEPVSEEIERQCKELELLDIIEPSVSSWSSPVVPVRKKDGSMRLCIDYRKLNAVTIPDRFPLPNLSDAVFSLHSVKYFTSLDLVRGYYQLPLEESSKQLTAFATPRGLWQFRRLSFGLRNAPSAFQREMLHVLSGFPHRRVIVYIDDVLIMSESFEEHLALVERVLATFVAHGIKVKPSKCKWFAHEVEYLGHIVSSTGLTKPKGYIEKVAQMPRPETVRQLREFLGLANFQRKFVPNFSTIQKPLSECTTGRGTRKLHWTVEMGEAFEALKEKICEEVRLTFPDYSNGAEPLELYVDASGVGAGACLAQQQGDSSKVIAYASTTFSRAQRHYSTIERELAALRWGVKTFRNFLIGVPFVIHTDHQPLVYLHNMKLIDSRLARTLEDLSDFNFQIRYTPGKHNDAADALSRLYDPDNVHPIGEEVFVSGELPDGVVLVEKVQGGGDSLFESLHVVSVNAKLKIGPRESPQCLRGQLVAELLLHPERYHLKLTRAERKKLRIMKYSGQLPCTEVLLSFSHLYGCVVFVHFGGGKPVIYSMDGSRAVNCLRVHLQCISGIHYNPVFETTRYKILEEPIRMSTCSDVIHQESSIDQSEEEDEVDCAGLNANVALCADPLLPRWCAQHPRTHMTEVMIDINGNSFCALLDTGAQVSCVTAGTLLLLGIEMGAQAEYGIRGIGPIESPVLGMVKLSLGFLGDCLDKEHEFNVVDDCTMPFCFLLGADYLAANNLSMDFGDGVCRHGGKVVRHFEGCWCSTLTGVLQPMFSGLVEVDLPVSFRKICVGAAADHLEFCVDLDANDGFARVTSLISPEQVARHQASNREIRTLQRALSQGDSGTAWPKSLSRYSRYRDMLLVHRGLVIYGDPLLKPSYVVTFQFLVEFMLVIHYKMAHIGRLKLIEMVRQHVWHPSMSKVSKDITSSCEVCQRKKVFAAIAPPIHRIQTSCPYELVALDLVMLPADRSHMWCLVVMDHCSKWLSAVPIKSKTSACVASHFERNVLPFMLVAPLRVLSDNGPEFAGEPFRSMLSSYGIQQVFTTPNKPSSNGLIERANRTLLQLLRTQTNSLVSWYDALPLAVLTHNSTFHSALNQSPAEYLLSVSHSIRDRAVVPFEIFDQWKEGNPNFRPFHINQKVLMKVVLRGHVTTNKFKERYDGPYHIVKVNQNGVTYVIQNCETHTETRAHHSQLKRYCEPPTYLKNHPSYKFLSGDSIEQLDHLEEGSLELESEVEQSVPLSVFPDCCSSTCSSESGDSDDDQCSLLSIVPFALERPAVLASGEHSDERLLDVPPLWDVFQLDPAIVKECVELQFRAAVSDGDLMIDDELPNRDIRIGGACEHVMSPDLLPVVVGAMHSSDEVNNSMGVTPELTNLDPIINEPVGDTGRLNLSTFPAGRVLNDADDFWEMSSLGSKGESHSIDVCKYVEELYSSTLGDGFVTLNERIDALERILIVSSSSSFSGFLPPDQPGSFSESLNFNERIVQAQELDSSDQIVCEQIALAERRLSGLREALTERRMNIEVGRSPIMTRSRGTVPDYPRVQPQALEYLRITTPDPEMT